MNAVNLYCETWKLSVNTTKTKIVIFSRGEIKKYPHFYFGNDILEVVECNCTYLGVVFNYNGNFHKAIDKQVKQAKRATYSLLSKICVLNILLGLSFELYNQLIMPILLYGCEIWEFENTKQIEIAHKKYLKQILKLNNRTPKCMIYGELGITSVSELIDNRMVNFWSKLVHGKNTQISHVVFKLLFNMCEKVFFQSPWLI